MRVGVLGVGRIGSFHVQTLSADSRVGEIIVTDVTSSLRQEVARQAKCMDVASIDQLVAMGVDAAVVATPTSTHAELLEILVEADVPTLCEKPVAASLEATRRIGEKVESRDAFVQVGFQRRYDQGYRGIREMIQNDELGRVYNFHFSSRDKEPPSADYLAGSGGIFKDMHIHDFDALRWMLDTEALEVTAIGNAMISGHTSTHEVVDTSAILIRASCGAVGVVTGGRHSPPGYDARVEVFGSKGNGVAGIDERSCLRMIDATFGNKTTSYRDFLDRFREAYRAELVEFITAVRDGQKPSCTIDDSYEAMRLAVAADRSLVDGRTIALSEVT